MELLGHDFFVFTAEDTEGTNVLYRRRDGDYGLIESR
jgi:putative sigma-54 modulation protein